MQLREYQSDCVEAVIKDLKTYDRVAAVLPTGAGKSIIEINIIDRIHDELKFNECILFLCHIKDLAVQLFQSYKDHSKNPSSGYLYQGSNRPYLASKVLFSTMQSAVSEKRRLHKPMDKKVRLIVIDEAQYFGVKSYNKICDEFYPSAQVLGLSATPFRENKFSFAQFDRVSYAIDIQTLIDQKFLVPPKLIQMSFPDEKLSTRLAALVKIWKEKEKPRKMVSVIYLQTIEQAKEALNVFEMQGARTEFVEAKTGVEEVKRIYHASRQGQADVIVNVNKISTGIDIPSVAAIFMPFPTRSVTQYLQRMGRALRLYNDKKEAHIYVFADSPSIARGDWEHIHDFAVGVEKDPETPGEKLETELEYLELDPVTNAQRIAWTEAAIGAVNMLESNALPDVARLVSDKKFPQKYAKVIKDIIKNIEAPTGRTQDQLTPLQARILTEKFKFKQHHIEKVSKAEAGNLIAGLMKYHTRSPYTIPHGPMAGKHCGDLPGLYKKNVKDPIIKNILRNWYKSGRPANEE